MRISDWSSDVCSSDLPACPRPSNSLAMRRAGGTTSNGWPRLRPGATLAPTPGTAAPATSDRLPLSRCRAADLNGRSGPLRSAEQGYWQLFHDRGETHVGTLLLLWPVLVQHGHRRCAHQMQGTRGKASQPGGGEVLGPGAQPGAGSKIDKTRGEG